MRNRSLKRKKKTKKSKKLYWALLHLISFLILTLVSQTGGIIYLVSIFIYRFSSNYKKSVIAFILMYALVSGVVLPWFSSYGGRVPLPVNHPYLKPANWFTVITNRHYVSPLVKQELISTAQDIAIDYEGYKMVYLDANFPFINGFPLIPHLSHDDGKKVDIAFVYSKEDQISNKLPSIWGYGNYVNPDYSPKQVCPNAGTIYGLTEKLPFTDYNKHLTINNQLNTAVAKRLLKAQRIEKIFVESYLKQKWSLDHPQVRFQGCHSVRHDDHFHIQFK
ncbi:hypothetical protein OO013_11420 [Mangrovivirga sp. M17]|uniref:Uncharacterized protein n=1 Tax=Mangrovivirga halotolerans TaxID=2993936 RepID=A0ABT3RRS3_9BACT|nr:hypothetical protein [Mangrovivirga halotolerans]MCX2744479.1 hypothetical protein [Mangrovivirga halotolerans]